MTWLRLLATAVRRISCAMPIHFPRLLAACAVPMLLALPAAAQTHKPAPTPAAKPAAPAAPAATPNGTQAGPKSIGKFDDWTAATHQESGATVCYAFTRAQNSAPAVAGRGAVIVTITQRPTLRDAVAIEAGAPYVANAVATVQVDQTTIEFYTDKRNAFARDGKAVATAFAKGSKLVVKSPLQKTIATDTFSLKGFGKAYEAIVKACPAK